jgi:single-strand DNA-binding protein
MINEAHISLSGYVATQPYYNETRTGVPSLSMRVAWTPRRLDRATGEWVDASTSFLRVLCYRKLAENAATCLRKGDPVVVRGRISVRDFEDKNGLQRTAVEVDAISVGHDLSRGVATFQRVRPQTGMTAMEYRAAEDGVPGGGAAGQGGDAADEAAFASLAAGAAERAGRDGAHGPDGVPGSADVRGSESVLVRDGSGGPDGGGPDGPGGEMFDEDAVGELAGQAASVTAPF